MSHRHFNPLLAAIGAEPMEEAQPLLATPELQQASYNRDEAVLLAKNDMNFLAALALPEVFIHPFPALFLAIWSMLTASAIKVADFSKYALGIPRGFAKTTVCKLVILWTILFTDRRFFLIIGSTASRAEHILADIADMLDEPNIKNIFGDWRLSVEKDTQEEKVFTFRGREIILVALGANSSLRGINRKNARPDFVFMDDMQTRENAKSPTLSNELLEWMLGTLLKTKDNRRCMFVYVGNMYPFDGCILKKLRHDTAWTSLIVGAILADGESLWPEVRSKDSLLDELASDTALGKPEIFFSEVMNDDTASGINNIDITKIPFVPESMLEELPQARFVVIDPSGMKTRSDRTAIGHFSVYDGVPVLDEVINEVLTPLQTIKKALEMCFRRKTPLIAVEDVAYQATLLFWFEKVAEDVGISGIEFVPVHPGGYSKNARIKEMLQLLVELSDRPAQLLLATSIRALVLAQIVTWNQLKRDNIDDLLDLLCYAAKVPMLYGDFIAINTFDDDDFQHAGVLSLEENTCF